MSNTAISAQGTTVSIGTTTGSALTITAVALTYPCRLTLSAVTGLNKGDVLTIAGVVGTTQINGNSYVVQYIEATTKIVTLAGLDATGFTTYVSGGTATPVQWTKISNVKSFSGFDGAASEIDRTNFDSTAKEFILGLFDPGQFTIEVDQDNSDSGQIALMTAQVTSLLKNFKLQLPNGNTATFTAYVKKFNSLGAVDQAIRRSLDLRISGPVSWA
ncbi:MAG: phage tail protein [Comamonadaceae bacterium]|nr:MAG: phage tail protein [Comamonadaceae bacterium]